MIEIVKPVVSLADKAVDFPDFGDDKAVCGYVESLAPEIGQIIARIVNAIRSGKLGLIGDASIADEIQNVIEMRDTKAVNPLVVQVIIMMIVKIIEKMIENRSR